MWLLTVFLTPLLFVEPGHLLSEYDGFIALPKVAALRTLAGLMAAVWLLRWAVSAGAVRPATGQGETVSDAGFARSLSLKWCLNWLRARPARWTLAAVWL